MKSRVTVGLKSIKKLLYMQHLLGIRSLEYIAGVQDLVRVDRLLELEGAFEMIGLVCLGLQHDGGQRRPRGHS